MRECQLESLDNVRQLNNRRSPQRTNCACRPRDDEVGAMAGDQAVETQPGDQGSDRVGELDAVEPCGRPLQLGAQPGLPVCPNAVDRAGILQEVALELHHLQPLIDVRRGDHIDAEAEPVEQLRPQLPLFGVHGAHQDEMRGMDNRDAFALDDVDAHCRRVEQDVHKVVVEQVDLVYV